MQQDYPVLSAETMGLVGIMHGIHIVPNVEAIRVRSVSTQVEYIFENVQEPLPTGYRETEIQLAVVKIPPLEARACVVANEKSLEVLNTCLAFIPIQTATSPQLWLTNHRVRETIQ